MRDQSPCIFELCCMLAHFATLKHVLAKCVSSLSSECELQLWIYNPAVALIGRDRNNCKTAQYTYCKIRLLSLRVAKGHTTLHTTA